MRSFVLLGNLLVMIMVATSAAFAEDYPHGSSQARLSEIASATEYWDFNTRLESGDFVFARFFITNEGPGIHTAAGIGTLVRPDGRIVPFRYGRLKGAWTLSPDRRMIDIASLTLDLRKQPRHFEMDSDKRGIKIHLDFTTSGTPVWSSNENPAHHLDVLDIAAPVKGTVWVQGMSEPITTAGVGTLTHAWMDQNEAELVLRQVEVVITQPDFALYATDFMPASGKGWSWLTARGVTAGPQHSDSLAARYSGEVGDHPRYPLPKQITFSGGGMSVEATAERELLRVDPIEVVPQPFHFLLSLKTRPERIIADAQCRVHRDQHDLTAPCLIVVTYLNPAPPPPP